MSLQRLAQGILLGEGFQFFVLVCERQEALYTVLDDLHRSVSEQLGEPACPLLLDPYLLHTPGSLPEEVAITLLLQPLVDWTEEPSHPIAVLDLTQANNPAERRDHFQGWIRFFQRMNERRNAIMRRFPGALLLVLPEELVRIFGHRASDFWSIRSGVHNLDEHPSRSDALSSLISRLDAQGAIWDEVRLRLACAGAETALERQRLAGELVRRFQPGAAGLLSEGLSPRGVSLRRLLTDLLAHDGVINRLLLELSDGPRLIKRLPPVGPRSQIDWLVRDLESRGAISAGVFDALHETFPGRHADISAVAAMWSAGETEHAPVPDSGAILSIRELREVLSHLRPEELSPLLARLDYQPGSPLDPLAPLGAASFGAEATDQLLKDLPAEPTLQKRLTDLLYRDHRKLIPR